MKIFLAILGGFSLAPLGLLAVYQILRFLKPHPDPSLRGCAPMLPALLFGFPIAFYIGYLIALGLTSEPFPHARLVLQLQLALGGLLYGHTLGSVLAPSFTPRRDPSATTSHADFTETQRRALKAARWKVTLPIALLATGLGFCLPLLLL